MTLYTLTTKSNFFGHLIILRLIVLLKDSLFIDHVTTSLPLTVASSSNDVDNKADNSNPDTDTQIPGSTAEVAQQPISSTVYFECSYDNPHE